MEKKDQTARAMEAIENLKRIATKVDKAANFSTVFDDLNLDYYTELLDAVGEPEMTNDKTMMGYRSIAELDVSQLQYLLSFGMHYIITSFVKQFILAPERGFKMPDETFCLFPFNHEGLKKLCSTPFEELERRDQEGFIVMAKKIQAMFLDYMFEK